SLVSSRLHTGLGALFPSNGRMWGQCACCAAMPYRAHRSCMEAATAARVHDTTMRAYSTCGRQVQYYYVRTTIYR
ncbi:hypothetical protein COCCADRAFT_112751, partial [Bipolaris zeicola 26-R-13]